MRRWLISTIACWCLACTGDEDSSSEATTEASSSGADGSGTDGGSGTGAGSGSGSGSTGSPGTTAATGETGTMGDGGTASSGGMLVDTWESWALPSFFEVYCNHCHPSDVSTRDFRAYDEVVANVEHIRCGVAPEALAGCDAHIEPGHLPIGDGPFPSDAERWRLVDWIDAGMLRDP